MADFQQYLIKERRPDGTTSVVASITSDDPQRAFMGSLLMVRKYYRKAGIEAPMFDPPPRFYAEPVGNPLCEE